MTLRRSSSVPSAAVLRIVSALVAVAVTAGCAGPLADGRHYGYVRAVDMLSAPPTISFDPAEFLTGDEADEAAVEDGVIAEGEAVPNDYYVRNAGTSEVEVPVAASVAVTRVECDAGCSDGVPGSFEPFVDSFSSSDATLEDEYRGAQSQYWVTVEGGSVVAIDEQYLP